VGPGFLNPADAARRLGVSAKALRLYEERGLLTPGRTQAGWRAYGLSEMQRAADIAALRALGFSLDQVARVLGGDAEGLEPALAAHQATLESRLRLTSTIVERIHALRQRLAAGHAPGIADLVSLQAPQTVRVAFDLPWPWGGERFELREMRAITWIIGPLGSGKTRFAERLAQTITGASFIGLDRAAHARAQLSADMALRTRVETALAWLVEDGATESDHLVALLAALESIGPTVLVFDLIEQGLDEATQLALTAHLKRLGSYARPIFAMTRSSAILDLAAVGLDEAMILCPANHSRPVLVAPHPGAPGYEAFATCLASPDVRARTQGVIAWRPPAA